MAIACTTCGNQNPDGTLQCQYCHAPLPRSATPAGATPAGSRAPVYDQPAQVAESRTPPPYQPPAQQYSVQPVYQAQPYATATPAAMQAKDPNTGLLLELLGYFGFLGIGWLWAGETLTGVLLLVGWMLFLGFEFVMFFVLIGFCFIPFNLVVPIASALFLQKRLKARQAMLAGVPQAGMPQAY